MNGGRAAVAGLVGTAGMTALLLVEPSVGLPKIAMGQVLEHLAGPHDGAPRRSGRHSAGCSTSPSACVLALIYAAAFDRDFPGRRWSRGVLYGSLVFLVAQVVFMPLVGGGLFSRGDVELIAGSLLGHLVYGGLTGWIYADPRIAA